MQIQVSVELLVVHHDGLNNRYLMTCAEPHYALHECRISEQMEHAAAIGIAETDAESDASQ